MAMHDIDRAMFEVAQESLGESENYEVFESALASETQAEAYETAMAAELLEAANSGELDQFLGDLVSKAASAVKGFASSSTGQALGGLLKSAARQVLPKAGAIIGNAIVPGAGGALGQKAGRWLGGQFEGEGLSGEDRDLEVARAVVRVGQQATRNAIAAGPSAPPVPTATNALISAANRNLPGLIPVIRAVSSGGVPSTTGRWVRRGRRIVVFGA
jgi:hypothetical protein